MIAQQRALERQARARQKAALASVREAERAQKAYERAQAAEEKERKRLYLESRQAEVEAMNAELAADVEALEGLLVATLDVDDYLDFETLKVEPELPVFQPGGLATAGDPPQLFLPMPPTGLTKFLPGAKEKHERSIAEARESFEAASAEYTRREQEREAALAEAREAYDAEVEKIRASADKQNEEIDDFRARFEANDAAAIVEYFSLVLDASTYPPEFNRTHRMAYVPESKQLVVEYELPGLDAIPTVKQYRYVRARDAVEASDRAASWRKTTYSSVVAQTTVRSLHELFEADRGQKIETIVFNGFVNSIDPATGKNIAPHLVTVRTSREAFLQLDLRNVEPLACLKGLNASVSKSPSELVPVRPILEFDMVDPPLHPRKRRPQRSRPTAEPHGAVTARLRIAHHQPLPKNGARNPADPGLSRRRSRLCRVRPSPNLRRQSCHPGQAIQEHRRCKRRSRPVRDDAKRRRVQGHPRHDERLRKVFVRVCRRQTARAS
ncbi:MAG TPA: hypothetical protein VKT78_00945 [Fimbriimonadaceae bacterium]|nr:hypothetical protein [Fimbriimonadaceae bacterium]